MLRWAIALCQALYRVTAFDSSVGGDHLDCRQAGTDRDVGRRIVEGLSGSWILIASKALRSRGRALAFPRHPFRSAEGRRLRCAWLFCR